MQKNLKKNFKQFNSYDEKEVKAAMKVVNSGKLSGFIADSSGAFEEKMLRNVNKLFKNILM